MRNSLLCLIVVVARLAVASDETETFSFEEKHLREMDGILNSAIAPDGRIMDPRPVPIVFAERHGITQEQLGEAIVAFARKEDDMENYALAASALGCLSLSPETNSIPYIESFTADRKHTGNLIPALFSLIHKKSTNLGPIASELIVSDALSQEERRSFYDIFLGVFLAVEYEDTSVPWDGMPMWLDTLKSFLVIESDDRLRGKIDYTLCDYLDGWKFSEERVKILRQWADTRQEQDERYNWSRIADETEEAIRTGKTEWILHKDRPRPPPLPRNPDGSYAVPKGQEHLLNQDDGIPQELKELDFP